MLRNFALLAAVLSRGAVASEPTVDTEILTRDASTILTRSGATIIARTA